MKEKITEPTWIIHNVFDEEEMTHHTHGLDVYGSLELEINLSISPKNAGMILNILGLEIANGKKFEDGEIDYSIFKNGIAFRKVTSKFGDVVSDVLRVIIPDTNFKFPWDEGCQEPYASQLTRNTLNDLLM